MASSFGLFNTAYSGLAAARAALEVTGENVSNVNTPGYTRQRVDQASKAGTDLSLRSTTGLNIGQGTAITGISRLNDAVIDARVRDTASSNGYWTAASSALSTAETSLSEPGDDGLSKALTDFWTSWGSLGSTTSAANANGTALLGAAQSLVARIRAGAADASTSWSAGRTAAQGSVTSINDAGKAVASLNDQILRIDTAGGNANELKDQRDAALTTLASLAGATTRQNTNGTIDVLVGGSTFVSGTTSRTLQLAGSASLQGAGASPVQVEFTDKAGVALQVAGGALAAQVSALAPAASGGVYASVADAYDSAATTLASMVNGVYNPTAAAGKNFFGSSSAGQPISAATLAVVPATGSAVLAAATGKGAEDTSIADAVGQLQHADGSPDSSWAAFVSGIGARSKSAAAQSSVATSAATAATTAQTSQSGVDLDEETANLVVFQHAYQGAARVMTTIDQMLDTLINHTGVVGIS